MKTSVFIQSKSIQVLCGKTRKSELTVTDWFSASLDDDVVVNGVIVNEASVRNSLSLIKSKLGNEIKEINLIIDSNSVFAKQLVTPILPHKKLIKLVESEFSDIENRSELLYDYMVLQSKAANGTSGVILASAVEKSFIESYINLFESIDIKIRSIDLALASVIRFSKTEVIRGKTCIVAILDGNTLNVSLFIDGVFRINNHTRLFQERGTLASASEITQLISSLIQFNQAEKTGREIQHVYFGGLESNELRTTQSENNNSELATVSLCERINASLGIHACEFPGCGEIKIDSSGKRRPFPLADYICSCGNLLGR
ncbi:MAG: pilus assembly protein PilM [Oscillospiraceae bacterium]